MFASINNYLGLELGCCDDLESLSYMLIYFLWGSLPWLNSVDEKLSSSSILKQKVDTTIADLCDGIPTTFANIPIYSCSLSHSLRIQIMTISVLYFTIFALQSLHQLHAPWNLIVLSCLLLNFLKLLNWYSYVC
jgi:hypothetical protein